MQQTILHLEIDGEDFYEFEKLIEKAKDTLDEWKDAAETTHRDFDAYVDGYRFEMQYRKDIREDDDDVTPLDD